MADRIVRIVLTGEDAGLVRSFEVAGAAAEHAQTKMERMQSVGRGMSSLGRSMTTLAVPILAVGAYAVKSAASFQQAMILIRTQAGASQGEVNRMSRAVLSMAPGLATSTTDMADGLYHIESAGYRGATALRILRVAAEGAKIGGANLVDVTNAIDAAVVSGIKGVQNYRQAMGALNATVGAGDMKMQDLADALSTGLLAPMKRYGLSLRDVGAALAVFGDNNIRGAEAGTKLSSAIRIMAAPSGAASKALAAVGLSTLQLSNDMRSPGGLVAAFKDLKGHLVSSGETASQQALTITRAFGGRQSTGVQVLLNQLPRLQQKVAEVTKGATGFGSAWGVTQKNVTFQWDKLKATAQVALVGLGKALMPIVVKYLPMMITGVKDVVHWVTHLPGPIKDLIVGLTLFLAIGGPILMFFGSLITAIGSVGKAFTFLAANPVVLVIAGVGVALLLLATHFKQVKVVAADLWLDLKAGVRAVWSVFSGVFSGLWQVISWPFKEAWKIIKGIFNGIVAGAKWAVHKAKEVLNTLGFSGNGVMSYINPIGLAGHLASLLHAGGPVRGRTHFDTGGPSGTDTVPAWLTPGEGVLNRAAMSRVGVGGLNTLNQGGGLGGNISITPGQVVVQVQGRTIAEAVVQYTLSRAARGPTSLVGGAMLTGSRTA